MTLLWIILAVAAFLVLWFIVEKSRRRTHPVSGGLQEDITLPYTDTFELYANAFSHCSRKTRLVMAEAGVPYKYHQIDLIETGSYETISAHYLKVNPSGLVPTLVHNGHPVYESDDILTYVSDHAAEGSASLIPAHLGLRAQMDDWIASGVISSDAPMDEMERRAGSCIPGLTMPIFVTSIRYIALRRIVVGFLFHPDKKRPAFFTAAKLFGLRKMMGLKPLQAMMHKSRDHMRKHLHKLDAQLRSAGGPWILGDQYTLADVTWSTMLLRVEETGWLDYFLAEGGLDALKTYYDAIQQRPSWHAAITVKGHPIVDQASADLKNALASDASISRAMFG